MSSTALDQWNGQPPGWTEPKTPEPGFHDWWETISEADKNDWIAEFVISKSGPLAAHHVWSEVTSIIWAYIDIDSIYVHDDWIARDRNGSHLTTERNGKALYRVDLDDLCSFFTAASYQACATPHWAGAIQRIFLLRELTAHVIHTYLMDWMEDEDNMRQVWEAL